MFSVLPVLWMTSSFKLFARNRLGKSVTATVAYLVSHFEYIPGGTDRLADTHQTAASLLSDMEATGVKKVEETEQRISTLHTERTGLVYDEQFTS